MRILHIIFTDLNLLIGSGFKAASWRLASRRAVGQAADLRAVGKDFCSGGSKASPVSNPNFMSSRAKRQGS